MEAVELQSVTKAFRHRPALLGWLGRERSGESRALSDVSLKAAAGSVLVLLGPNGSGKTTTLKLISTMLLPDSGEVIVGGASTRLDPAAVRRQVGFAVANERSFFPRLTARENLVFFATLEDVPRVHRPQRVDAVLERVELRGEADTLAMKFSSGMFQRLGVARALLKDPSILLLDEPTRSLDPGSAMRFWASVREVAARGTTVILTTHNFTEAASAGDVVVILREGRVVGERQVPKLQNLDELRAFYFEKTGESEPVPALPVKAER